MLCLHLGCHDTPFAGALHLSATCEERDRPALDTTEVHAPLLIVEVLSDSTEAYDRGEKLGYYLACPSVQEYVLVATRYQGVEVYRRTPHEWIYQAYGPDEELELSSIKVRVAVAAFYKGAGVPERVPEPADDV